MKTHRCGKLLEYNKYTYKPCSITFEPWLPNEAATWILRALKTDFDSDTAYMCNIAKITYCPFCGKNLLESE